MTIGSWILLGVAVGFAGGTWIAVAAHRRVLEYVCKPAATSALVAMAVFLDPVHGGRRSWFVAALACSLAGDVFLMLPEDPKSPERWFIPGLGSFLLAQVAYVVGFSIHGGSLGDYAIGAAVVAVVGGPVVGRFVRALKRRGDARLVVAVLAYFGAIGAMVASAIAGGNAIAIAGAGLFMASDSLIGETRFVAPRSWGPLAIIVTYHLAQVGLVVSLV